MRIFGLSLLRPAFLLLAASLAVPMAHAQVPSPDVRGLYVYTNNIPTLNSTEITQLNSALLLPGIDGIATVFGGADLETAPGQYSWTVLDQWIGKVAAAGKKIDLVVTAGNDTPNWLFQPAPAGGGATPLTFSVTSDTRANGICQSTTIAKPWDPAFLAQWDAMLAALSAHLKAAGTYNAVTLVRLTGINQTTEELRLPVQTPATTASCVTDAIALWQSVGYRPSLLLQGWQAILNSFQKSFPDKSFDVSLIPFVAFPGIAEDGSLLKGTVPDRNQPLLAAAAQTFPGRIVIQFDSLLPNATPESEVAQAAQTLGSFAGFQTNEYLGGTGLGGAGCSPEPTPVQCTSATFLNMLEEGIYPLGRNNSLRSRYIEIFRQDALSFPDAVLQAHLELTCVYALNYAGQSFAAAGGTGTITITTGAGCPWTLGTPPAGVTFTSATSGTGSATVTFQVAANAGGDLSKSFTIVDQTFTVEQQASRIGGLNYIGSMPHLAAEGGWNTTFTFVNKGSASAIARTNFLAPDGTALPLPTYSTQPPLLPGLLLAASLDQTIAPNASIATIAAGPAPAYLEDSAQLAATSAVDGFAIFHYVPNNQEAVVPMETRNAASYLLPFDNAGGVLTGVAIENVSANGATIPVVIRDDTGAPLGNGSIVLNGAGHTSFVLSSQFSQTANKRGTIEFDTPGFGSSNAGQISVLGIRYTGGTLTTIPVLANVNNQGGLMAHLASGAGWQTKFVLVNAGSTSAQAQLAFYADNGSPLSLPLTFPQGGAATATALYSPTIAPGASLWIQSSGPVTSALLTGSAQLRASGNISGFVIFRYNPNGQEAVVPLENRNANSYVLAFDNTGGTVTGVALNLISAQGASVPVVIRNDAGVQIGASTIALNANGHTSFTLTDPLHGFPVTANIRGTVEFATPASSQISVLGIRSPPALTFTTLPALAK
jgi:hypothetical protein